MDRTVLLFTALIYDLEWMFMAFILAILTLYAACAGFTFACSFLRDVKKSRQSIHQENLKMNILLIYPEFPDTFWSFKHALHFIGKKASSPPLGLVTVAAMLPKEWNLRLIDLNVRKLTQVEISWCDMLFISAMVVQRDSAQKIIELAKIAGKIVVAGGPLFTSEYQNFPFVDHFILNEAEITLPQFLEDLNKGCVNRIYQTDEYADIRETPVPRWDLIRMDHYDSMSIQFSRGCPFNCDFCSVTALLGHLPRTKTSDQIIAELDLIYQLGWRRNIFFVDDNFIGNKKVLKESVLPDLIEWREGKKGCHFITEASINLADDNELIDLMTKAGFNSVFIGVETPSEEGLAECHKVQNKNRNLVECVKTLHRKGLQVMGGFIVGFDSDTPTIFQRQIDFIQASGIVTAMVGILQAPYGTALYQRLRSEGRLVDEMNGDNADGLTNIIPRMDLDILQKGYRQILNDIYSPRHFYKRVKNFLSDYRPAAPDVHLEWREISAFFKSIYWLGIRGHERTEYWRLFFWTLSKHPSKFALAITLSIYGFHFWRVYENHILPNYLVD
jgi:radical SAM superfamily enzyme YgiQ (UPF0313 family)